MKSVAKTFRRRYNGVENDVARKEKCLYCSTNARNVEKNLTSWYGFTRIKCLVPTVAVKRREIILGRCFLLQGNKVKNAPEIVKLAVVAAEPLMPRGFLFTLLFSSMPPRDIYKYIRVCA